MKLFSNYKTSSEYDGSKLVSGYFYASAEKAACHDGAVVVVGALETHGTWTTQKDLDNRKIVEPTATTATVAIVDYVGVSSGTIQGVLYRDGIKTAGLTAPANEPVRVRVLTVGDTFFLGEDNFNTAPAVGKYAAPTANDTIFTVADTIAASTTVIEIEAIKPLTEGVVNTSNLYFCRVVALA